MSKSDYLSCSKEISAYPKPNTNEIIWGGVTEYSNAHTPWLEPFTVPSVLPYGQAIPTNEKGNNPMYATNAKMTADMTANVQDVRDANQRRYLRSQADDIFYEKKDELKFRFFIYVKPPETVAEYIQRIKDGAYTLDEKYLDKSVWNVSNIDWRTPDQKEDKAGYEAARAKLEELKQKLEEDIEILSPREALDSLRAFREVDTATL